jgi:hypothetical protein
MGDFILESWYLLILLLAILFVTFQLVKWRDLFLFLDLLLYQMHGAFECSILFFYLTFFNGIDFLCFLSVLLCVCLFLFLETMAMFFKILTMFLKLHQKYEILQFFL